MKTWNEYTDEQKERYRKKAREYYIKHKQHLSTLSRKRYTHSKEHIQSYNKKWAINNKTKVKQYSRKYYKSEHGAATHKRYMNKWRKTMPLQSRFAHNLRARLLSAIKNQVAKKITKTRNYIGCTWNEAMKHIESKFAPGMTWDNWGYGRDKWHIDHIIPCAAFDLTKEEEQNKCFHYTNLQPLWQTDNLSKGDKTL